MSESHGENPAFFRMNQKGKMTIARKMTKKDKIRDNGGENSVHLLRIGFMHTPVADLGCSQGTAKTSIPQPEGNGKQAAGTAQGRLEAK